MKKRKFRADCAGKWDKFPRNKSRCSNRGSTTFLMIFLYILMIMDTINGYSQHTTVKIGISKASPNYINWLKRKDTTVVTINLFEIPIETAVRTLATCDGLLLTGGEDVYPGFYGKVADTVRCKEMDRHRDTLDFALITKALELKMPVMAICRGHQILNVALGGSLIINIPTDVPGDLVHQCDDYLHCTHEVSVIKGSMLYNISHAAEGTVTTNHHQAIERLAPGLVVNAVSADKVIEGIEWKQPSGKSWLLGVQWHPERMETANPLSGPVSEKFLEKAAEFRISKAKKSGL